MGKKKEEEKPPICPNCLVTKSKFEYAEGKWKYWCFKCEGQLLSGPG